MKCPLKDCGATFRQEDVMTGDVYDTLHGRHIGHNWLSYVKCPSCEGQIVVKQTIKLEVFGYGDRRRSTDEIKDVG